MYACMQMPLRIAVACFPYKSVAAIKVPEVASCRSGSAAVLVWVDGARHELSNRRHQWPVNQAKVACSVQSHIKDFACQSVHLKVSLAVFSVVVATDDVFLGHAKLL